MLRNLIIATIGALIIWAIVAGIQNFFYSLPAKDRALASATFDNLRLSPQFKDHFVDFKLTRSGDYRCDVRGMTDAEDVGRFAYNAMVVLSQRNDAVVKTGRTDFTIQGYQDNRLIFEVTYNYNPGAAPQVTLKGQFSDYLYVPRFGPVSSAPIENHVEPALPTPAGRGRHGLA